MIKAVIIDDEQHSIDTLQWKLKNYCSEVAVVAAFTDPVKALDFLRTAGIDLLFMDIEMPMLSGFEVLEELGEHASFDVIFITAYDSFGIKAIKFSALDYLLKPVQNKELVAAIQKHLTKKGQIFSDIHRKALLNNVEAERTGKSGKIGLASKESIEFVEPSEIIVCEASSNYTIVHLQDGTQKVISKTLKDFEDMLLPFGFFRPHNSYLINLSMVNEYVKADGGYLIMSNKLKIPVSKNKKEQLLSKLSA